MESQNRLKITVQVEISPEQWKQILPTTLVQNLKSASVDSKDELCLLVLLCMSFPLTQNSICRVTLTKSLILNPNVMFLMCQDC